MLPQSKSATQQSQSLKLFTTRVQRRFRLQPNIYREYLGLVEAFNQKAIRYPAYANGIAGLFHDHPDLIIRFNSFVPVKYRIDISDADRADSQTGSIDQEHESEGDLCSASDDLITPKEPHCLTELNDESKTSSTEIGKEYDAKKLEESPKSQLDLDQLSKRLEWSIQNIERLRLALSEEQTLAELYYQQMLTSERRCVYLSAQLSDARDRAKSYQEDKGKIASRIETLELEIMDLEEELKRVTNVLPEIENKNRVGSSDGDPKGYEEKDRWSMAYRQERSTLMEQVKTMKEKCTFLDGKIDETHASENDIRDVMMKCIAVGNLKLRRVQLPEGGWSDVSKLFQSPHYDDPMVPVSEKVASFCSGVEIMINGFSLCYNKMKEFESQRKQLERKLKVKNKQEQDLQLLANNLQRELKIHENKVSRVEAAVIKQDRQRIQLTNLQRKADRLSQKNHVLSKDLQKAKEEMKLQKKKYDNHDCRWSKVLEISPVMRSVRNQLKEAKYTVVQEDNLSDAISSTSTGETDEIDANALGLEIKNLADRILDDLQTERIERRALAKKLVKAESEAVKITAPVESFDRFKNDDRKKDDMTIRGTTIIEALEAKLEEERQAHEKVIAQLRCQLDDKSKDVANSMDREDEANRKVKGLLAHCRELLSKLNGKFDEANTLVKELKATSVQELSLAKAVQNARHYVTYIEQESTEHRPEEAAQRTSQDKGKRQFGIEDCMNLKSRVGAGELGTTESETDDTQMQHVDRHHLITEQGNNPVENTRFESKNISPAEPENNVPCVQKSRLLCQEDTQELLDVLERLCNAGSVLKSKISSLSSLESVDVVGQSVDEGTAKRLGKEFLSFAFVARKDVLELISLVLSSAEISNLKESRDWHLLVDGLVCLIDKHDLNSAMISSFSVNDKSVKALVRETDEVIEQVEICKIFLEEQN